MNINEKYIIDLYDSNRRERELQIEEEYNRTQYEVKIVSFEDFTNILSKKLEK